MSASTSTAATRLRLTPRGRRALASLIVAPLLAVGAWSAASAATAGDEPVGPLRTVTVQYGESLWQIAASIAPEADPRDVVAAIESLNNLQGSIQPGQELAIPPRYDVG